MKNYYNFSKTAYLKANCFKICLIYILLVMFFVFALFLNGTLDFISGTFVIVIFALVIIIFTIKMISIRNKCQLKFFHNCLEYRFIRFNGMSPNMMTKRYEEDIYYIYEITRYNISSTKIKIYGRIKKEQRKQRNFNKSIKTKEIKFVEIPIYFSDKKQIIQNLKEFQEVNYGQRNDKSTRI